MSSKSKALTLLALLIALGLQRLTLTGYPPPHCDETHYSSAGWAAITAGEFGSPVHGPVYGLNKNFVAMGRLYLLGVGIALKSFGLSLTSARLFSLLGWLAAVAATYGLGLRLYDRRTAIWGACLFGLSWKAFAAAHFARPEIWLAAGSAATLGWLVVPRPRRAVEVIGIGLGAALLLEIHSNGLFFLAAFGLVAAYQWLILGRRLDLLLGFLGGVGLGLGIWAGLHLLPDPTLAWHQLRVAYTRMGLTPDSVNLRSAAEGLVLWVGEGFWQGNRGWDAVEGTAFLVGIGYALYRRSRADVVALLVLAASLASFALFAAQKSGAYRVVWAPLLWLMAVEGLCRLIEGLAVRLKLPLPIAGAQALLFVPILALYLAGSAWLVWQFRGGRIAEATERLRAVIPAGVTVLGDPVWWFGLSPQNPYISDYYLAVYASWVSPPQGRVRPQDELTQVQVAEAMHRVNAQYVILDPLLHCMLTEPYPPNLAYREYVTRNCELVGEVAGGWYGQPWARTYPLGTESQVYRCG